MYPPTIADSLDHYTDADDERALSRLMHDMMHIDEFDDEADNLGADGFPDPFDGVPADTFGC